MTKPRPALALSAVALIASCAAVSDSHDDARGTVIGGVKLTGTVVVVNQRSDSITLIDLRSMTAYKHVPVVGGPHEAAVSPDGRTVAVTNYHKPGVGPQNDISFISLPDGETLKTISLGEYSMPHDIRWVDADHVVCTSEANQALLLLNVETGKIERVFETGNVGSHMLALTTDRSRLYCYNMGSGSVTAFDFKTGKKIKDISTGRECEGVGVTQDGRWIWAGNRAEDTISIIDTETLTVVKQIDSAGFPYRVQFTADGAYALIPHARSGELVVADVASQRVIRRITLGADGVAIPVSNPSTAGVFPHPDGRYAFVTVRNDDSMVIIDIQSGKTVARVAVQSSPDGVCYSKIPRE